MDLFLQLIILEMLVILPCVSVASPAMSGRITWKFYNICADCSAGHLILKGTQAKLPSPRNLSMKSINMKHSLYWDPVFIAHENVTYSVQFQGEYESTYKVKLWNDVDGCQSILSLWCNMTEEIASNVQYKIRVRAELGDQVSDWANLSKPFLRNASLLTPPTIKFKTAGPPLILDIENFGPYFLFYLFYWKKGKEEEVVSKKMNRQVTSFHLEKVEEGYEYCAQVIAYAIPIQRNSSKSSTVCAAVQVSGLSSFTIALISFFGIVIGLVLLCALMYILFRLMNYSCCPQGEIPETLKEPYFSQNTLGIWQSENEKCEKISIVEASDDTVYAFIRKDILWSSEGPL